MIKILFCGFPCFVAGTQVYTHKGYKNIEDIRVGDMVLTHKGRFRAVTETGTNFADKTYAVKFQCGTETIVTENHPYYIAYRDKNPDWVEVKDLRPEEIPFGATPGFLIDHWLVSHMNKWLIWSPLEYKEERGPAVVYNISVAEDESYVANNMVVHNCTKFSIANNKDRETHPYSGEGWELFYNGLLAKEKWKPDYILFENNYSIAQPIKDAVSECLGVGYTMIDSAKVSAQQRKRCYWTNFDVPQPEDRGILLRDILESGIVDREKSYALKHQQGNARDYIKKNHTQVAFEPIRVGTIENEAQREDFDSKQYRVYSPEGKATTLCGQGGGVGAKTGLYATPIKMLTEGEMDYMVRSVADGRTHFDFGYIQDATKDKGKCLTANIHKGVPYNVCIERADGTMTPVYEVRDGAIKYKDIWYPINLPDGYYIIRKLTVNECRRLQTIPDWYKMPVSATQSYKMLGNGWTNEVIMHILSQIPNIQNEEIEVLSMYDGMAGAMIALRELCCNVVRYDAYEIDKYCIQTAKANFPEIIHHGDAFELRRDNWSLDG